MTLYKPNNLTLPGSIPGLLRRGSPVVTAEPLRIGGITVMPGSRGVMSDLSLVSMALGEVRLENASMVALDLTDPTGRAHAAWWLMGLTHGHMLPVRRARCSIYGVKTAIILAGSPQDAGWGSDRILGHPVGTVVPALADLDPDDPRLLPGGSRWVDAEALRLVCLHVSNQEQSDAEHA